MNEKKISALNPCPFCGNKAVLKKAIYESNYVVLCVKCKSKTGSWINKDTAIELWNQRVPAEKAGG
mgnify:FL=1